MAPSLSTTSRREPDSLPTSVTQAPVHHRTRAHGSEQKAKEGLGPQSSATASSKNDSDSVSSLRMLARNKSKDSYLLSASVESEANEHDGEECLPLADNEEEGDKFLHGETVAVQTNFSKEQSVRSTKLKKPNDLDVLNDKAFESSRFQSSESPVLEGAVETVSPTTGVYTAPSHSTKKQQKATRKTSSSRNIQKSTLHQEQTPPPICLPNRQDLKRDHLVRKESESSVKSVDSESTASSGDKSDEKDLGDTPSQIAVSEQEFSKNEVVADEESLESPLETKTQILIPMGKEPNTGQTMPASEDVEIIINEEVVKKEKVKTKKKQRQLKREEKARKKEKEKTNTVSKAKDKQQSSMEEPGTQDASVDSSVQTAVEKGNYGKRQVTTRSEVSKVKGKFPASSFEKYDSEPSRKSRDVIELVSGKSGPASLSQPAPSVPSTAIKSSRGGTTKLKDIMMDPFSRNPDRSTYASKKNSSKKSLDRPSKSPVEESCLEEEEDVTPKGKTENLDTALVDEEEAEWVNAEGEDSSSMTDNAAGSAVSVMGNQQQQNVPTPHDLAASVLSKLPMKIKKVQNSPAKSTDSIDYDEEEGELVNANMAGSHLEGEDQQSRPSTISPGKDDSFSSPSPTLSSGQQKPSTLSLDAQPFYPSSNFKASKKQGAKSTRSRGKTGTSGKAGSTGGEGKYPDQEMKSKKQVPPPFSRNFSNEDSPNNVSPVVDPRMLEHDYYQHHRPGRKSPPSPVYNMPYGPESQGYDMSEQFYDVPEHPPLPPPTHGAFRRVPDRDPRAYYSGTDEPPFPHAHMERDMYLAGKGHHSAGPPPHHHHPRMPPRNMYPSHKMPQHPNVPGYMAPPPGYESPPSGHAHLSSEEEFKKQQMLRKRQYLVDLYRQERAALAAAYAREQARKSAEALNSLHRPSALPDYPMDIGKPSGGVQGTRLWEDYREYDDEAHPRQHPPSSSSSSYGIVPDDLEFPHMMPSRTRTMSSGSDIGGEILTGYQLGGQSSSSVGPPGYKRAPGAEYNGSTRVEQSQAIRLDDNGDSYDKASAAAWSPTGAEVILTSRIQILVG